MKKLTGITLAGLLFTGLVGCSETETKPATSEPKQEVKAPAKAEAPKVDTAVADYLKMVTSITDGFGESMSNFSTLTLKVSDDPSVMQTNDWKIDIVTELTIMDQLIKKFREIDDVPPAMNEAHKLIGQAFDEYQFVIDNFPSAIDNLDVDLINQCTSHIQEGSKYIELATAEILKHQ